MFQKSPATNASVTGVITYRDIDKFVSLTNIKYIHVCCVYLTTTENIAGKLENAQNGQPIRFQQSVQLCIEIMSSTFPEVRISYLQSLT